MFFSTPHAVTQTEVARAETVRKTPTTGFDHPTGRATRPQRKKRATKETSRS